MDSKKHNRSTLLRIEHICTLMRDLKFQRGETYRALAAEWRISEDRVKRLTAEASRIVYAEVTDPERAKPEICSLLRDAMHKAYNEKEYQAVASLGRVYGDILGFRANTQTTVKIEGERSPQEAKAIIAELFGSGAMPAEKKVQPS